MLARVFKAALGVLLMIAGVAMLILPGPGILTIAIGVALVLSQSPRGRQVLARLRLRMRERYGSARVQRVEARIPDEVCPPSETCDLRELAENPIPPPPVARR